MTIRGLSLADAIVPPDIQKRRGGICQGCGTPVKSRQKGRAHYCMECRNTRKIQRKAKRTWRRPPKPHRCECESKDPIDWKYQCVLWFAGDSCRAMWLCSDCFQEWQIVEAGTEWRSVSWLEYQAAKIVDKALP